MMKKFNIYLLSFVIPFFIMMGIFIGSKIYPFGDESFLHIDMYHQYFPFLVEFYHKLRNGESLFYSWNTGIGSNFLGLFVYYLATPLYWFVVLCPEKYLMEFISYLVVIKIGLCGVTFSYYFSKHFKTKSLSIVLFSVFYALSGYMAAYNWNVMWLDTIVIAPLIILGLEQLVYEGKCLLYCVTLTFSILTNYYISVLICEFLVLYFIVLLISANRQKMASEPLHLPLFEKIDNFYLKAFLRFGTYSLFAGGMSAVLLLPEFYTLKLTEFSDVSFPKKISSYFAVIDMLARHCINVDVETALNHWPNIYCGVAIYLLLPLYIIQKKIPMREKIPKLSLLFFLLISFSTNVFNFIWHGFNYPDSLPARQSFLYIILLLTLCYEAFLYIKDFSRTEILHTFGAVFIFLLLCEKLVTDDAFDTISFLLTGILLVAYSVLIHMYRNRNDAKRYIALFTLFFVLFEAAENTAVTSVPTVSRSKYLDHFDDYEMLVERTRQRDNDFYRFEKFSRTTQNDAMLIGFPSASLFSSTSNAIVKNFYDKYGMKSSRVYYCYDGATPLMDALLAIRYKFSLDELPENALYQLVDTENDVYLYQNPYALPFGFMIANNCTEDITSHFSDAEQVNDIVTEDADEDEWNPFHNQNELVAALGIDTPLFDYSYVDENGGNATIYVEESGYQYAYSTNTKVDTITASSYDETKKFKDIKKDYILDLGYYETGDEIDLSAKNGNNLDLHAYRLNEDVLRQVTDLLKEEPFILDAIHSTSLTGSVHANEAGYLVLSMPYEPGWKVTVDGVETDITLFEKMMVSIPLEKGDHTISLHYTSQGFYAGLCISTIFLASFIALYLFSRKYAKAKSKQH